MHEKFVYSKAKCRNLSATETNTLKLCMETDH